jgi:hypothetical protein
LIEESGAGGLIMQVRKLQIEHPELIIMALDPGHLDT